MPKTQVWTPDMGFTRKSPPPQKPAKKPPAQQPKARAAAKPETPKPAQAPKKATPTKAPPQTAPPEKKAQAAERTPEPASSAQPQTPPTAGKAKPTAEAMEQARKKAKRERKRQRRQAERRIADDYITKQIQDQTPMVFIGYGATYHGTVTALQTYALTLSIDGQLQEFLKHNLSIYYKARDMEAVAAVMERDEAIACQNLQPIIPPRERYQVNRRLLRVSRDTGVPIRVVVRTGHVLVGSVRWFTPYDIGLMLSNQTKVQVFCHSLYDVVGNDTRLPSQEKLNDTENTE